MDPVQVGQADGTLPCCAGGEEEQGEGAARGKSASSSAATLTPHKAPFLPA